MKIEDIAKLMLEELKNSQGQSSKIFEINKNSNDNTAAKKDIEFDKETEYNSSHKEFEITKEKIDQDSIIRNNDFFAPFAPSDDIKFEQQIANLSLDEMNQDITLSQNLNSLSMDKSKDTNGEIQFLLAIKERILVLFEGLSAFDKGDIEARVELNLKFMEFLLASIDNRVENLQK